MNTVKNQAPEAGNLETDYWDPLLEEIRSLLAEIQSGAVSQAIHLDHSLERDIGFDSLTRVELLSRIERRFGLALPEDVFSEAETPRDLIRELSKAASQSNRRTVPLPHTGGAPLEPMETAADPARAQTLVEVLEWHLQAHPTQPHIQFYADDGDGEVIDYQCLYDAARALAGSLQRLGVQPGEPVAIMLPTGRDYFTVFFGILLAGAIPVPIYPPLRPSQLEDHLRRHTAILGNCRAVTLITVSRAKQVARLLKAQLETLRHIVTVDELLNAAGDYLRPPISPHDTAFLQYTSGSTGNPKGVVLTHANLLANIRAMGERVQANAKDVFVSWLPLYHDMGLIGAWLGSLYYAALLVIMSPLAFLARPQRWLQAIHRYRGTLSAAPNFGYELCLSRLEDSDLEGLDLSSWRAAFNGAEAVSPKTVMQFPQRFAQFGFPATAMVPVYGLAECSVGLAFPPIAQDLRIDHIQRQAFAQMGAAIPAADDEADALRFVACGQVLAGHEIRIVDAQSDELPDRQEGRLQFRGPSSTSGYLHNREATQKLFDGDWLNSGDLAYISEGDLYVTGRTKDVIIRAGRNLYPHELEEAVGDMVDIRKGRVAVFGATDPNTGTERLVVLAETRKKEVDELDQLRQQVNNIASKLIGGPADDIVLARPNTVLKTSSGKIRRAACRELYERGFLGKTPAPLWWQVSHLLLSSVAPQLRRFRRTFRAGLWALHARIIFWLLAPLAWLGVVFSSSTTLRWWLMRVATRLLTRLTCTPFRVEGLEKLPDKNQPCVFVANHASYLDGPLLIAALDRPFSFVAKIELAKQAVAGLFLRRIGTEFVERFDAKKGVEDASHLFTQAKTGRSLFFFPEGTFTRSPGLRPFHLGAFLTAAEAGLPIVPVAIRGTRSILRSDAKFPHRGSITITVGNPIWPQAIGSQESTAGKQQENWTTALILRDQARAFISRHAGEPYLDST
ncbi:MAG TPA: acyl-phosphate glycerol 3-phosphate acyltransferase [Gammaproteobacteria bacterium]|nr:acyl-phosphate glycerol 3-phosphate acyltransferase [Gammaproteobacteria bacterium]